MIQIIEVGPRDGLQNEKAVIPTDVKVAFVDALSLSGLGEIEVSAFVSPRWVPQLADAAEVFAAIARSDGIVYSALVPNEQGLERALAAHVPKVAVFTAASETFNKKNVNATIAQSIERFEPVVRRARDAGLAIRGYVSTAFWCPYEGRIDPRRTREVIRMLTDQGIEEISIGDTIGRAVPDETRALLELVLRDLPPGRAAMHFHDTFGNALANVMASLEFELTRFDSSTGGLGGCPYAPGASGNVSTQALVRALREAGHELAIDLEKLDAAEALIAPHRSRGRD